MTPQIGNFSDEIFLGEFVPLEERVVARIGPETFHWFIVRRKNDYPVHVCGQYVRAERDGSIAVIYDEAERSHTVAQFSHEEVEGVFEGDTPVVIRQSA
jgi:hypothetical protein